jgi:hypothetical protein
MIQRAVLPLTAFFVSILLIGSLGAATVAPQITSPGSTAGVISSSLSYQITANNSPTNFTATNLPSGVVLNATTGLISGTFPSKSGTTVATIAAIGASGSATATLNIIATECITLSSTVEGTTPDDLGYNLGHYQLKGNAWDWFRYTGVKAARIFISASDLQSSTSPGKKYVTSSATFTSTVASARALGTSASTYVKWSDFNYDFTTSGSNEINLKDAFTTLTGLGVKILANITCSPSTFPLTGDTDYAGRWEIWQHYYAQAYLLSRDYGIYRFAFFNEPNGYSGETPADWLLRVKICSDAVQSAIADMNAATGKNIVPQIFAPNTASGATKYNTGGDTWGYDAVTSRHVKLDGSTLSTWFNFHVYNYQKYSLLTDDSGSSSGYIQDIDTLSGYIKADMGSETTYPIALTEYNVRTGSQYDTTSSTQDSPTDYVALGANSIALTAHNARQLYCFKFGQTADSTSPYGVAKNGTHYVDNDSSAHNYGAATKAAEVYRLFNKASKGARSRYTSSVTSGAASSTTSGLWRLVTRDPETGNTYVYLANKKSSSIPLSLNATVLGIADGTPFYVEEVSSANSGGVAFTSNVSGGQAVLGSIPAESVWLVTIPGASSALSSIQASDDSQIGDGTSVGVSGGSATSISVRADGTVNGTKAALIKIATPSDRSGNLKSVLLDLGTAITSGTTPVQVNVYGVKSASWSESSATWSSLAAFLRQGVTGGNSISNNPVINTNTNSSAMMLGQLVVNSTVNSRRMLDVTEFVKSQSGGSATFLITQDHRWNHSADLTTSWSTGDFQSAGLSITSKEKANAGPRLLPVLAGASASAPVLLSNPQDQYVNTGGGVTMSVSVDGSLPVTYQWKKDGVAISGATASTLALNAVGLADAGSYTVDVTSSAGTTTSSASTLAINAAPVLVTAPQSASVYVGDTVSLNVLYTGYPDPTYQWSRNGTNIPGATGTNYSFTATSTNDGGTFSVVASNSSGSGTSTAVVTVNPPPTGFVNISSTSFSYSQNFDTLLKSTTLTMTNTNYCPWTDGATNGSNGLAGWFATTDQWQVIPGYRTVNYINNEATNTSLSNSGLGSMGSASSSSDRAFGGIPWTNNGVYMGIRLRNSTGKIIDGCTVAFKVEQYSSSTALTNVMTTLALATQTNATSLRSGTWVTQTNFTPMVTNSTYKLLNGTSSANNTNRTVNLTGLQVAPGDDLWVRWLVSTTSTNQPIALAIDDLSITNLICKDQQTISLSLDRPNITYGDDAPVMTASSTSGLPVTVTSSDTSVVTVDGNNLLTIVGAGSAILTANQAGNATTYPAAPVTTELVVSKASQTVTLNIGSSTAYLGDAPRTISATASSGLAVTVSSSDPSIVSVTGTTLGFLSVGEVSVTASQSGNANYSASSAVASLQVLQAIPSFGSVFPGQTASSDANGDGVPALLEYAFGGNPNSNNSSILPVPSMNNNQLVLTYRARINDPNLTIVPEVSTDLANANSWSTVGITTTIVGTIVVDGTTFEIRNSLVPTTDALKKFLRVRVQTTP